MKLYYMNNTSYTYELCMHMKIHVYDVRIYYKKCKINIRDVIVKYSLFQNIKLKCFFIYSK